MTDYYNPLLSPGIHDVKLEQIDQIFVAPFNNLCRKNLIARFLIFLSNFNNVGINCEIWIDGSFATDKPEPSDIDIIFFFSPIEVNHLPEEKKNILYDLFGDPKQTKFRYNCDAYFIPNDNIVDRSYWRGWFGFSRDEKPKGIARLIL
ncbi:MAG: hypothetical protein HZB30_10675 [Nitrospirae bacterium]|nr:hypothetical protein [Nitrospirota bacterium]